MKNPTSILIIDDNLHFLKTISEFITEKYTSQIRILATAQNGNDGICLARQLHPQVVVLDLMLPDMHGFTVIPLLRQIHSEVIVITTTFLSTEDFEQFGDAYSQESLNAGANIFIPKYRLEKDLANAILKQANSND